MDETMSGPGQDLRAPLWVCELRREMEQRELRYMQRMDHIEGTLQTAVRTAKEAVDKAEIAANNEFKNANNVKAEFAERLMMLMPRQEIVGRMETVEKNITDLAEIVSAMAGKGVGMKEGWGYLVGAAGLGALVLSAALSLLAR